MSRVNNILGKRYGKLLCVEFSHFDENKRAHWYFKCDCDRVVVRIAKDVTRARGVRSCGDRKNCIEYKMGGASRTKSYMTWKNMMARCYRPTHPEYSRYGGKGIEVCSAWHNLDGFLRHFGEIKQNLYIDRVDPNKNYEPENCRLVDQYVSCQNTSRSVKCRYKGKTYNSIRECAIKNGMNPKKFYNSNVYERITNPPTV